MSKCPGFKKGVTKMKTFQTWLGSALMAFMVASAHAEEPKGCVNPHIPKPGDLAVTLLKEPAKTWDVHVLKGYGDDVLKATKSALPKTLAMMWGGDTGNYIKNAFSVIARDYNLSTIPDRPVAYGLKHMIDEEMKKLHQHGAIMQPDRDEAVQLANSRSQGVFKATLDEANAKIDEAIALTNQQAVCDKEVIISPEVVIDITVPPLDMPPLELQILPDAQAAPTLTIQP